MGTRVRTTSPPSPAPARRRRPARAGAAGGVGLSGLAVHLPPYRVDLRRWCEWTGEDWGKIRSVVGTGFRLPGPDQNTYTMAATAVLRLIDDFGVDPRRVRFLALATESSTDNAAGAVIVKGLVDQALAARRAAPLARACEVPEVKHACLAGVYALKAALRFLATDGGDSLAIVVCADQALYERGSSGEPTQGAGAVALLLSRDPAIATVDLAASGSASDFRHLDFRKPLRNRPDIHRRDWLDTPIFNGKYSTNCYLDEVLRALEDLYERRGVEPIRYLRGLPAAFLHRPYRRMPETGWGMAWLAALAGGAKRDRDALATYCREAHVKEAAVRAELLGRATVTALASEERIRDEVFPNALAVLRVFRESADYDAEVMPPLRWGADAMAEFGNLYTGALPAWLATGLAAAAAGRGLPAGEILLVGYGSGDAAEALPIRLVPQWRRAARRIDVAGTLRGAIPLTRSQYEGLRDHSNVGDLPRPRRPGFRIERVGVARSAAFQDLGVEYYRYVG